jgi:signal transduction histidine kinase
MLGFGAVGALITSRRPGNRLGWLFLLMGLGTSAGIVLHEYTMFVGETGTHLPGADWAAWGFTISIEVPVPFLILILLLFPHGRALSRRWSVVGWTGVGIGLIGAATTALADVNFSSNFPGRVHPVQVLDADAAGTVYSIYLYAWLGVFVAAASGMVVRFRRSTGEERLQVKWFTYAAAVVAAAFALFALLPLGVEPVVAFIVFLPFLPLAAGVAILKYRLYDIDVVINKTLVYGSLAAFITAVYVGVVVGIGSVFGRGDEPNLGLSILATAVVAVAFQPVRGRVQKLANRLVYGRRATPYEVLSEFSHRMAGTYAAADILPRMARILAEGTGGREARVWLRVSGELTPAASWPDAGANGSSARPEDADLLVPVTHQGEDLGALSIAKAHGERLTPAEDKLTRDLASQAGLVLRNVRLIEELKASRVRLVQAQDQERRRIERNIHDGAQQQLVALQVKMGLAKRMTDDPAKLDGILAQLQEETNQALQDLRDLARGIFPPLLADRGLTAALEAQARKSPLPVTVEADSIGRYPQEAEAAVYFCVLEALQNAAKYAGTARATVRLTAAGGELAFEVVDDGAGFDPATTPRGAGLTNMADRLAVLGGDVQVLSDPGSGTTVSGRIPAPAMEPVA